MQSGIYWGYVGLLQGIVSRIKEESKTDMKVVATGGLANLFSVDSDLIDIVDLDLTIKGIAFAWNPSTECVLLMKLVTPPKDKLLFLPLGGSGEIGMNLNLYGYDGHWLIVDCGVTFGDIDYPSVDIVMPDISVIEEA